MNIFAVVSFQFEALHHWPDASGEVEFLKYPHRHVFHVKVWIEERGADREIEFITMKRWLESITKEKFGRDLGARSCEQVACEILEALKERFPGRKLRVEVYEDGENGAVVER